MALQWFQPAQGGRTFGVTNLTNDPTVRDWANYHNANCWSHDGRYVCFTRFASDGEIYGTNEAAEVHVVDLRTGEDRRVGNGLSPRWANRRNWLFYVRFPRPEEAGPPAAGRQRREPGANSAGRDGAEPEVWWLDLESGEQTLVGHGMHVLGGVSYDDRWLIGGTQRDGGRPGCRLPVQPGATLEVMRSFESGIQWIPNPCHDVAFVRVPNRDDAPFAPTRYWFDLDGTNVRVASVTLERCHQSWLGNGEYYLLGNSQVRGRRWDQPFPSSLHFLANVSTGDVSPCGRSGRFVTGDKPLTLADLRSGDGWVFLEDLSVICYPAHVADDSGPYDSDPKGSPDGTKVCFVSNYDLKDGPVTFITRSASETDDRVEVESTAGFPPSGEIVVYREVIGYTHTTPTSFEGVERKRYNTSGFGLRPYSALDAGEPVTLFAARCIPEQQWKTLPLPAKALQRSIGGLDTPLIRQRSTDVYLAAVRRPDRPYLLMADDGGALLVPGESHYETMGYRLLRDGEPLDLLRPGARLTLAPGGAVTAVSVEWSGLESEPSNALTVEREITIRVLAEPPADFSWTDDRWLVDGEEVDLVRGLQSAGAVKEIHHRYDGLIAVEWFNWGTIMRRHDLNRTGQATRRLFYHQGRLARREYYTADGAHRSTEHLDARGNVTEMVLYREEDGQTREYDHWWFEDGMPVRRIGRKPARRIDSQTPAMYIKAGDEWVRQPYAGKQPAEAEIAAARRQKASVAPTAH